MNEVHAHVSQVRFSHITKLASTLEDMGYIIWSAEFIDKTYVSMYYSTDFAVDQYYTLSTTRFLQVLILDSIRLSTKSSKKYRSLYRNFF